MKTMLKKKILPIVLTAIMLLGAIPAAVQAADPVCQIGSTTYATLGEALNAVAPGQTQTIKLISNINYSSGISITDKAITFDLNGFTLNVNNSISSTGLNVSNGSVNLTGQGSFNVTGYHYGVRVEGGKATVTSATATGSDGIGVYAVNYSSRITVSGNVTGIKTGVYADNGGVVVVGGNASATGNQGDAVYSRGSIVTVGGNATAVNGRGLYAVSGGRVTVKGSVAGKSCGVDVLYYVTVNIGGSVTATNGDGVYARWGANVTVQGNINAHATGTGYFSGAYNYIAIVTVNGNITATGDAGANVVGVRSENNGGNWKTIVKGTITAPIYIRVSSYYKTADQGVVSGDYYSYIYSWDKSTVLVKIPPIVSGLTAETPTLNSEGGQSIITVSGNYLLSGLTVTAFDGETATAMTALTTGSKTEQTATLTFPANTSIEEHKVYTIKVSADSGVSWSDQTASFTVTRQEGPDISGYFTDTNFKQAVWEWLGNEIGSTQEAFSQINLTERMVDQGYSLDIQDKGIKSLAGLGNFQGTGLLHINCARNLLISLPDLPDSLTTIDCSFNYINLFSGPAKDKLDALGAVSKIIEPQFGYPSLSDNQLYIMDPYTLDTLQLYQMITSDGLNWTGSQYPTERSAFSYVSSDSSIATVDAEGTITAAGDGSCDIYALFNGIDSEYTKLVFHVTAQTLTYPLTYESNGGTGTTPVEDGKIAGASFEVASVLGLTAPSSKRFKEWNTDASGTGTAYPEGAMVTMPEESLTLYAIWEDIPSTPDSDSGGNSGETGQSNASITSEQIAQHLNSNEPISLNLEELSININPSALPAGGNPVQIETDVVTDPDALNTFFLAYPDQTGIMKGYSITFTQENNGESQSITQLDAEITLTFKLTPEELEGLDPSTLVVYKQGEDGSVTTLNGNFDWTNNTLSVNTSHLCTFYLMAKEGIATLRLSGDNRYSTAAAISAQGWEKADNVILVNGTDFPDALAGAVLAGYKLEPILLTNKDSLPDETLAEIKRLQAKTITILGGEGVVSKSLEDELSQDYTVVRVFGSDRYQTAVGIGQQIISDKLQKEGTDKDTDTIILATGHDFPDALAATPFAGQNGLPILFTQRYELNIYTRQAMLDWQIKKVIIIGGTGVISEEIEKVLRDELNLTVLRLSGEDRYLTALSIAKYFDEYPQGSSGTGYINVALAAGTSFSDALAGASLAAKRNYPILLTPKDRVNPEVADYIRGLNPEKIYIYGGTGAISDRVKNVISLR